MVLTCLLMPAKTVFLYFALKTSISAKVLDLQGKLVAGMSVGWCFETSFVGMMSQMYSVFLETGDLCEIKS